MELSAFTRLRLPLSSLAAALALAAPAAAQVKTEELKALDLWSAAGRDTGLPADLWKESSADLARSVLAAVPDKPLSPAAAALARRVLATGATAPDGAGNDADLAGLRARALVALGDAEAAATMVARTPRPEASEPLSRARAEAALLLGREAEACETEQRLQEGRDGPWWLKLRAFCRLAAGETAAAQVTLDLWRQKGAKEPGFDALMAAAVQGGAGGKASLSDPLAYALTRRLKLDPTAALPAAPAAVAVAIAQDAAAAPTARIAAAARALRLGVLSADTVRTVYAEALGPVAGSDVAGPAKDLSPQGEAGLATLAATTGDVAIRQEAVLALMARAKTPNDFVATAKLVTPRLAELAQAGVPLADPAGFATAAAVAGDPETARAIRARMEQDASPAGGATDLALLDALVAVATGKPGSGAVDRLIERGGVGDAKQRARAQAAALLLVSAAPSADPGARARLASFDVPAGKTTPARTTALYLAAARRLPGETALYALSIALQQPAGLTVADRAAVVGALAEAGLRQDARALALEGLVAQARP
jgi:hypothetical protein